MMERRRRQENPTPKKTNNSIEDLVQNEENEYPVPDPNRTMINIPMSSVTPTKKSLTEETVDKINEKLREKLQNTINQKVQGALKKYQDPTDKKLENTKKQLK
jgi:hypothetical protein